MIERVFKPKTFNDTLALFLLLGIPGIWAGNHWIDFTGEVIGATIAGWTLVIQYYFRRRPENDNGDEIDPIVGR